MAYPDLQKIEVGCLMISANDFILHPGLTRNMESRVPKLSKVVIDDSGLGRNRSNPRPPPSTCSPT
jgi:hypothetical protein